jgi:hypothetical protein
MAGSSKCRTIGTSRVLEDAAMSAVDTSSLGDLRGRDLNGPEDRKEKVVAAPASACLSSIEGD